jgi:arginase
MRVNHCTVIDAPSDLGLRSTGVDRLPDALRAAGLLEGLAGVRHAGRVPRPPFAASRDPASGIVNAEGIRAFSLALASRVSVILEEGRFPVVLGGDCSILLGPALALRRRGRFGLLFMDGHADFYSPESEPNGEAASMDLALATGYGPASLADLDGLQPLVRPGDVVVFGFRDADSALEYGSPDVRETEMHTFDLGKIREVGALPAARRALAILERSGLEGFWIHLDADVLHDEVMPAVDYRMPDGLWPQELSAALAALLSSPRAVGLDVTIYNPALDDAERSAGRTFAGVITAALAAAQGAGGTDHDAGR